MYSDFSGKQFFIGLDGTTIDSDSCTPALVVTFLLGVAATIFISYPNYLEVSNTDSRLVFVALVPITIGLLGWPFIGLVGRPRRIVVCRPWWVAWLLAAFLLNLSGIVVAYGLQWTIFTYGDQVLSEGLPRIAPWALAGSLLAGVICWEFVLRRVVVGLWASAGVPRLGVVFACTLGFLLAVPSVLQGLEVVSISYVTVGLFRLFCLEIACTAIALRGPGVIWAGCYRGLLFFTDAWVIGDWYSPLFPGVNYVASGGLDYWVYGGGVLMATILMVILSLRVKKNGKVPEKT